MIKKIKKLISSKNKRSKWNKKYNNKYTKLHILKAFLFFFNVLPFLIFTFVSIVLLFYSYFSSNNINIESLNEKTKTIIEKTEKKEIFNPLLYKENLIDFKTFYIKDKKNSTKEDADLINKEFDTLYKNNEELQKIIKKSLFYKIKENNTIKYIITDLNGNISYYSLISKNKKEIEEINNNNIEILNILKTTKNENKERIYKIEKENNLNEFKKETSFITETSYNVRDINSYSWRTTNYCYQCNNNNFDRLYNIISGNNISIYNIIGNESFSYYNSNQKVSISYQNFNVNAYNENKISYNIFNKEINNMSILLSKIIKNDFTFNFFVFLLSLISINFINKLLRKEKTLRYINFIEEQNKKDKNVLLLEYKPKTITIKEVKHSSKIITL